MGSTRGEAKWIVNNDNNNNNNNNNNDNNNNKTLKTNDKIRRVRVFMTPLSRKILRKDHANYNI